MTKPTDYAQLADALDFACDRYIPDTTDDTLAKCRSAVAALRAAGEDARDARRYRWLRERFVGADFMWGDREISVIVFRWPLSPIWADLDGSIDEASAPDTHTNRPEVNTSGATVTVPDPAAPAG